MDEVDRKINAFINLLKERTINPIENTDIKESCTASLLLIFAAVDSLSKITCDDKAYIQLKSNKGQRSRFIGFLENVMSNKYSCYKEDIYNLRNDIMHTGINSKVILSKKLHDKNHLQKVNTYLWINTNHFLKDLKDALEQINLSIKNKDTFYQNAMTRIKDFNLIKLDEEQDIATPSPGPDESLFQ